jgi:hypothetical protein
VIRPHFRYEYSFDLSFWLSVLDYIFHIFGYFFNFFTFAKFFANTNICLLLSHCSLSVGQAPAYLVMCSEFVHPKKVALTSPTNGDTHSV